VTIVLKHQVEAAEQAADELEQMEDKRVPICYEVQDLLKILVEITDAMVTHVERVNGQVERGEIELDVQEARQTFALFGRLNSTFSSAGSLAQRVERYGYTIDGKDKFITAWQKVSQIACFDFDSVIRADAQFARGEGRDLGDFMNELRDQTGT
jgi:hypothetical protein